MPEKCYGAGGRRIPCPPGHEDEGGLVTPAAQHEEELFGEGVVVQTPDDSLRRQGRIAENNAQQLQRQFLEEELSRIRVGSSALRDRAEGILTLGRRNIREQERIRLGQAESGLSAIQLSESGLGERVRRAERETTAFAEADLESRVRIEEMGETFKAEQSAIERLYQSGEANLAYLRQVRLIGIQAQYARELAELESGNAFFGAIGEAVSTIASIALYSTNPGGIFGAR